MGRQAGAGRAADGAAGGGDGQRPDEIKAALKAAHPGWDIWYVCTAVGGIKWCARPKPLLNQATPEDLTKAIKAAENPDGSLEDGSPAVAPLRAVRQ